ncbi:MAG TPA: S41 family peptidase, partial [Dehalococcoidia bacterium]|nr:S41 family peptidase [Dehalococcoidia bacterium]
MHSAYLDLLDAFREPQRPDQLLQPALDSLLSAARAHGVTLQAPSLPDDRDGAFAVFAAALAQYARQTSDATAQQAAFDSIQAMAGALQDDHTGFIDPTGFKEVSAGLAAGAGFGSGFALQFASPPFVRELAPGGPAQQAGLRPGDELLSVNGKPVSSRSLAGLRGVFAGDGGPYGVQVRRPGAGELDFRITPGPYHFAEWSATVLPGGVGLMRLREFIDPWRPLADGRTIDLAIDGALNQFEAAGVTHWVLDLRDNPGGSGLLADALSGRFVPDGLADRQFDGRGHAAQDLVDGRLFPVQRPLAVLVNGGSTSASDLTASIFKESGRALLVGQRTGGALGNAAIWPVGAGAGIEVSFADMHSGRNDAVIDRVGVPVDVSAPDRTAADFAAGRDPQLDAAIAALSQQGDAAQPAANAGLTPLGRADIEGRLLRYLPAASALATALPGVVNLQDTGGYTLLSYNDYNNWATATVTTSGSGGARDAIGAREAARQRGWLGGRVEVYGGDDPLGASLWIEWDAYQELAGAEAALAANDFPDQWQSQGAPLQLGDGETEAYSGGWGDLGTLLLRWRRGAVVITAEYQAAPGAGSADG